MKILETMGVAIYVAGLVLLAWGTNWKVAVGVVLLDWATRIDLFCRKKSESKQSATGQIPQEPLPGHQPS